MGKISTVLGAIFIYCLTIACAEPPASSYSINGGNNVYDYSNTASTGGYLSNKNLHRGNRDFYTAADDSQRHSLTTGTQTNVANSAGSSSYNEFTSDNYANGFSEYSDSLNGNSYSLGNSVPNFDNYPSNTDSTFGGYSSQTESDLSHYSANNHRGSGYSSTYPTTGSLFTYGSSDGALGSSSHSTAGNTYPGGYTEHDIAGHSSHSFSNGEYPYKNHKEGFYSGNKYENDVYSSPSDTRFIRGSHSHLGRKPASGYFAVNQFGGGHAYPGRLNKYGNKYVSGYSSTVNYLPNSEVEYVPNYVKSSGKLGIVKESGPGSYPSYSHSSRATYFAGIPAGSYKGKSGYVKGYTPTYTYPDSHLARYGSSVGGHGSVFPGFL